MTDFLDLPRKGLNVRTWKLIGKLSSRHKSVEDFCKGDPDLYKMKGAGRHTVNAVLDLIASIGMTYQGEIKPVLTKKADLVSCPCGGMKYPTSFHCEKCRKQLQQIRKALQHIEDAKSILNRIVPDGFLNDEFRGVICSTLELFDKKVDGASC
jgi:hypothetical protein